MFAIYSQMRFIGSALNVKILFVFSRNPKSRHNSLPTVASVSPPIPSLRDLTTMRTRTSSPTTTTSSESTDLSKNKNSRKNQFKTNKDLHKGELFLKWFNKITDLKRVIELYKQIWYQEFFFNHARLLYKIDWNKTFD